jgi:hypothetical protein
MGEHIALPGGYLDIATPREFVNNLPVKYLPESIEKVEVNHFEDGRITERLLPLEASASSFFANLVSNKIFNPANSNKIEEYFPETFEDTLEVFYTENTKFLEEFGNEASAARFPGIHQTAYYFFYVKQDWSIFLQQNKDFPLDRSGNIICLNEKRSFKVFKLQGDLL